MSSRKSNLKKYLLVNAGDMSATITSGATNVEYQDNIGIQFNFTGTPTGTFTIQTSVDYDQDSQGNVITAGNWNTIPTASNGRVFISAALTPAGSAGSFYVDINQLAAPWVRVVYTRGSGSGTLNVYIAAKVS